MFCLFKCSWLRYVDDTITAVHKKKIYEFQRNLEKGQKIFALCFLLRVFVSRLPGQDRASCLDAASEVGRDRL